jgi:uncharacterized membrane protein
MPQQPIPDRMAALSDGLIAVSAVVVTSLVLDFKGARQAGLAGLGEVIATLAAYFVAFTFVGVYWVKHHHLGIRFRPHPEPANSHPVPLNSEQEPQ